MDFFKYDNAMGIDRDVDKTTNKIKDKENLYKTGFGHVFLKVWGGWLVVKAVLRIAYSND